jgi:hypothetical protein
MPRGDTGTQSTSSWIGTVLSRDFHSAKPSSYGIGFTWKAAVWHPVQSPSAWGSPPTGARRQRTSLLSCVCVIFDPQFPRGAQRAGQYIFVRRGQANMGMSHPSPAARNGQENLGCLLHEPRLLHKGKRQVSVALCLRSQRGKSPTPYPKGGQPRMGNLFHARQAQRDSPKICCGHRPIPIPQGISSHGKARWQGPANCALAFRGETAGGTDTAACG